MNEDGQVLRDCIGQILRWSRTCIEELNMESQERSTSTTNAAFDFNEEILPGDTIRARNMEDCKEKDELKSMKRFGSEGNMGTKQPIVVYLELMVCHPFLKRGSTEWFNV